MIVYTKNSIFASLAQTLVNPVNCSGVMGKGLAAEFKRYYPAVYEEYRQVCLDGALVIGSVHVYKVSDDRIILNFPTKRHWSNPSFITDIQCGLKCFVLRYKQFGITSVAFPKLGCGNGGLYWNSDVKPLMEHYLQDLPIPVYIHV